MADHRADQLTGDAAGGPVTLTFAELEFVLRSAGERGVDPAEPLSAPVLRFIDLCTSGGGEATVLVRTQTGDGDESGVAVARSAAGAWFMSDSLEHPDPGRPIGRAAVVARLRDLLAQPVGV